MTLIKREKSNLVEVNPTNVRVYWSFSNQALGTCLKPYKALLSLHTRFLSPMWKPLGRDIQIVSWKSPFKNALLKSTRWIGQPLERAILRIIWVVIGLTIELKVSWKSNPSCWWVGGTFLPLTLLCTCYLSYQDYILLWKSI